MNRIHLTGGLGTPLQRRLEMLAVLWWFFTIFPLTSYIVVPVTITALFLFPLTTPLVVLYFIWLWYDRRTPERGGRPLAFLKRLPIWRYFLSYYPMTLHRDEPAEDSASSDVVTTATSTTRAATSFRFDSRQKYIFGLHPHGVITLSAMNFLMTPHFDAKFEDLRRVPTRLLTLTINFWLPMWRDYILGLGLCSVSEASINYNLQHGNSVAIVVGGAAESLDAHPGTLDLTLQKRKGFVRLAIQNGASLVPVLSFGENDLYDQFPNPPGSSVRRFQEFFKRFLGFSPPFFHGRGIFNLDFGLLPHRKPVHTVVGAPIACPSEPNPSPQLVDQYHARYLQQLQDLYLRHRDRFFAHRTSELRFI